MPRTPPGSKEIEHRCDKLVHELVKTLHRTFITPIDREDIHDLGSAMDDVVDLIDAAASRAVLFKVEGEIPDASGLARVIHTQAEEMPQGRGAPARCRDGPRGVPAASTIWRRRATASTARPWRASSSPGGIRSS